MRARFGEGLANTI